MAEMTRTTLTGSPQPDGGVPLFSSRKRQAASIPSSNWKHREGGESQWVPAARPIHHTQTEHTNHSQTPHLSVVPRPHPDLILRAVVNPSDIVQDVFLPLGLRIHEHGVLWCRTSVTPSTTFAHLSPHFDVFFFPLCQLQILYLLLKPTHAKYSTINEACFQPVCEDWVWPVAKQSIFTLTI